MSIAYFNTADISGIGSLADHLLSKDWTLVAVGRALEELSSKNLQSLEDFKAKNNSQDSITEKYDLVVANLFGHQQGISIAKIADVETRRVALIRDQAKAGKVVLTSIAQYESFEITPAYAQQAAVKAFRHTAHYDNKVNQALSKLILAEDVITLDFHSGTSLRYGENSHQSASFYSEYCNSESSLANAKQLWGKELSYNNIVDADAALEMVREFTGQNAVAVIKHLNPAGLATGSTLAKAFEAAWQGDPISAFGSVIACSQKVDLATAERLHKRFVEILLAPGFDDDAVELLKRRSKNIRILEVNSIQKPIERKVYKHVIGGMLVQDRDASDFAKWECVTESPFPGNKEALGKFTWLVTKHTKSNAIVMGYEYEDGYFQVLGLGPGQPNRIDSLHRLCRPRVKDNVDRMEKIAGLSSEEQLKHVFGNVVTGSDAFFPFADSIEACHEAGVKYVIQPGGSVRDQEVIDKCNELGISMIFTGMRHFRH
jgi:phosphoribosylaminoimidazolecarboxamide formyltransferase/IMP cyclohydrolase